MSQRTPAKSNGAKATARTPAATPAAAAAAPATAPRSAAAASSASGKKPKQAKRAPSPEPEPEPEEEAVAAEDEEDASQYSEPEEVDNDGLMDEFSRNQPDDDDDDADEDEDADGMSDEEEEEEEKSAAASSGKKRAFDGASASGGGGKKTKSKKDQAAPSNDEMQALRQTEDLFKSNLFKLQMEEMLKEMDVGYDKLAKVEPILHGLKASLESIPTQELSYDPRAPIFGAPLPATVMASVASSTATQQHAFPFHAPSTFNLVGSYPLKTLLRDAGTGHGHGHGSGAASLNIDVVVEMPAACLKEKDYWDYRYLAKRSRFLEHLAAHLMESGRFRVKIGKMRGAAEKPVVLLYPLKEVEATQPAAATGSAKKKNAAAAAAAAPSGPTFQPFTGILSKVVIRLFVSLPAGLFNPKRFHPSKSNLHAPATAAAAGASSKSVKSEAADDKNDATGSPTPYYNSLLLEDMFYTTHLATLYALFASTPALKEALMLLKLWTKQHQLDLGFGQAGANGGWGEFEVSREGSTSASKKSVKKEKGTSAPAAASSSSSSSPRVTLVDPASYLLSGPAGASTGFNGFFLSMFLSHLMSTKQIYRSMSTYQLFKVALQSLVKIDMLASAPAASGEPGGVVHGFDPSKSMHSIALLTNPLAVASTPREVELLRSWTASRGFEVLFLDGEGSVNFAARISKQSYLELKQEAFLSLSYLDDSSTLMANIFGNGTTSAALGENAATIAAAGSSAVNAPSASMVALQTLLATSRPLVSASALGLDSFQTLFMTRSAFHTKFDAFVRVELGRDPAVWSKASKQFQAKQANSFLSLRSGLAADSDALSMIVRQVSSLLELALGDRIQLLHVRPLLSPSGSLTLEVGLMLNPFHANRILDMGPSADATVPALHFRDLWGELSTLRRFKDGSIVEAVVWTTPSATAGGANVPHSAPHLIPFQIISFVLGRHLGIPTGAVHSVVSQLDSLLKLRAIESQPTAAQLLHRAGAGAPAPLLLSAPSVDPSFLHASTLFSTFKSLSASLKSLHAQIPLNIVNIRMVGEFSRYTSVFASPVPVDLTQLAPNLSSHSLVDVVPVLLQFESSSKWPEDSLAISRIKSAFYIQFGKALNEVHDVHSIVSLAHLDILYHGFVFRLRIFYEAELQIRRIEEKMGLHSMGGPLIPVPTSAEILRDFVRMPLLSQQLKFVQEQYPLFAPTVRLVKRWVSAHMFSPFFEAAPESIELLVVGLFTNPKPYAVPSSILQGLHRWLAWLASFDFEANPVIVDLSGEMKTETIDKIHAKFTAQRASGEGCLIYVATEMDPEGSMLFPRVAAAPATSVGAAAALPEGAAAARGDESGIDGFVLARLVSYARSSLLHFDALLEGGAEHVVAPANQWKTLFKTPLSVPSAFDLLIHLKVDQMPVQYLTKSLAPPTSILASAAAASAVKPEAGSKKQGYKLPPDASVNASAITLSSTGCSDSRAVPLVGFNPLEPLLASLRHLFGALAYFFCDTQGGTVIGVVWRPEFRARIAQASSSDASSAGGKEGLLKWSVKNAAFAAPVHDKKTGKIEGLRLNVAEIIADMKKAGAGLVDRIDTGALAV